MIISRRRVVDGYLLILGTFMLSLKFYLRTLSLAQQLTDSRNRQAGSSLGQDYVATSFSRPDYYPDIEYWLLARRIVVVL